MRRAALGFGLAAALLGAAPAGAAPGGSGGAGADTAILTQIGAAQVAALIEEAGGVVTDTLAGEEGFAVNFQFANGLHAYIEGYDCTGGPSVQAVCSDLELGGVFTADDEAHALRLERELSFVWVSDYADTETDEYLVWRRDCLHGGVTATHVGYLIGVLDAQLTAVSDAVWPEDGLARSSEPVET